MTKHVFFNTKEKSNEEMHKHARFQPGDEILVCADDDESTPYYKEEIFASDLELTGGVFCIKRLTNHTGTWSGTWKYAIGKVQEVSLPRWRSLNSPRFVDFGMASKVGKCHTCKYRLAALVGSETIKTFLDQIT